MTKEKAESMRALAISAVKETQTKLGRALGPEREQLKRELEQRLTELAQAKAALRKANLALSGATPIEPPAAPLTTAELATRLIESFEALLIRDPNHAAIRALRAHFEGKRLRASVHF